jgi:hypothetical protein
MWCLILSSMEGGVEPCIMSCSCDVEVVEALGQRGSRSWGPDHLHFVVEDEVEALEIDSRSRGPYGVVACHQNLGEEDVENT